VATVPVTAIAAITGTVQVDEELTAGALTPSAATVTYQWKRAATSGGTYSDISGETSSTYTLESDDEGKYIKVAATGTGGYSDTVTSAATAVVAEEHHHHGGNGGGFSYGNGNGNGGNGTVTPPAAPLTREQLQAAVNSIIAQINALIVQARALGIQLPLGMGNLLSGSGGAGSSIVLSAVVRPLSFGAVGDDVKALQNFLVSQNKGPAALALGRNGTTTFFGLLTKAALAEFQGSVGLPATGYFGPLTKAYLKTIGF
jgi:peptidoglycan hydrolase-like protein with peptidoglycan-binding domain